MDAISMFKPTYLFFFILFFSFTVQANLLISPSSVNLDSSLTCTAGSSSVESYVNSIKNNIYVTAEETTTDTTLFKMHYPSNVNNSDYRGYIYIYKSDTSNYLSTYNRILLNSGGYVGDSISNTQNGTYYISGVFQSRSDISLGCLVQSNTFSIQQAPLPPDLIVSSFKANNSTNSITIVLGESVTLTAAAKNIGQGVSQSTTLSYKASVDSVITSSDPQIGTVTVGSLNPNDTSTETYTFTPTGTGSAYLGACIDAVPDESNTSNNCSNSVFLTVVEPIPDLEAADFYISPSTITAGQSTTMTAVVTNNGTGASTAQEITYYASPGPTIDTTDEPIGNVNIPALSPGGATAIRPLDIDFANPINIYLGACVSIDPNEENQANNCSISKYLKVKANKPSVNPPSGVPNQNFTFSATLAASTPNGFSYYLNFDDSNGGWLPEGSPGGHVPIPCSGTSCSVNTTVGGTGTPRLVRMGLFRDSNDTLTGLYSDSASFNVSEDQPPTVTYTSGPALSGHTLTAGVNSTDEIDITKVSFVIFDAGGSTALDIEQTVSVNSPASYYNQSADSWGYDTPGATPIVNSNWSIDVSGMDDGNYEIMFNAADTSLQVGHSSRYAFTKSSVDQLPVVTLNSAPQMLGNTITADVESTDDNDVTKVSFQIYDFGGSTALDIEQTVSVNSPASIYNQTADSWGYDTSGTSVTSNWSIDISGLPAGDYEIQFNAADNVPQIGHSPKYSFTKSALPTFADLPRVTENPDGSAFPLKFSIELTEPLPNGYGLFLNFDDLQGDWFEITDPGGHLHVTDISNNIYSYDTGLAVPGLRYFRFGIFDTLGDGDDSNDVLIEYSNHNVCDLEYCINETIVADGTGNPAVSGSGSQLFKNVDVASGNFHLSSVDLSVPGLGPSFAFSRAYNSRASQQWTFGYEMNAQYVANTYDRQLIIGPMEDGRILNFFKNIDFDNASLNDQWFTLNQGNFNQLIENGDGSFFLFTQGNRIYHFANPYGSFDGRLVDIRDRVNQILSFQYNGSNDLTGITDANGRTYSVTRDGNNRVSRITDFTNRYVEYTYDANGMLKTVRDPRGYTSEYFYTYNTVVNGDGVVSDYRLWKLNNQLADTQFTLSYDNKARVENVLDGEGQSIDFAYSYSNTINKEVTGITRPQVNGVNHNIVFVLDDRRTLVEKRLDTVNAQDYINSQEYKQPSSKTSLAERSLVTKKTEPLSWETTTTYADDGTGNPLTVTDELNRTITATWENNLGQTNLTPMKSLKNPGIATAVQYSNFTNTGKAQSITDARGNPSSRVYNAVTDLMTSSTDAENNTTTYGYNGFGYLESLKDPENNETTSSYDSLGRLETITTPLGLFTTYVYDNSGNITNILEQGSGHTYTTTYHFDAAGNLEYTIDPRGFRIDYTYDTLGRKKTETYTVVGSGTYSKTYDYDALGRLATTTNERNQPTQTRYTARSKIEDVINPLGETVSYSYDANGNVESITDGEGHTIIKTYDELNRVKRITDDNNNYEEYTYTTAGFVDTYRNKNGVVTKYGYDNNGNQTSLQYVGHPELDTVYSTYDKNNKLESVTDAEGHTTTYSYNSLNQLAEIKDHLNRKWIYTYDANGNQLTETMPDGERTVSTYDAFNRIKTHKEYSKDNVLLREISYDYDENGNVKSKSNGSSTLSYEYDELNRIKTATGHFGKTIGYRYDGVGNITKIIYPGNKDVDYTYDFADRMETVSDWLGNTTTYVTRNDAGQIKNVTLGNNARIVKDYDVAGRLTLLQNKKSDGTIISSHSMTLDDVGNIKNATTTLPLSPQLEIGKTMTYDNTNRLLTSGGDNYSHDLNGRIVQNSQNGDSLVYTFNTKDLITQIEKNGSITSQYTYNLSDNRVSSVLNGVETRYVIDENSGLPNVIAETNSSGVIQRYYIYGDEGLLSQIDSNNNVKFYHYDPTGNTLTLTDNSQVVTDKYAYTPYGTVSSNKTNVSSNPFLYNGKHGVMDDGNGLNYMRARYYKPDLKRFMSLDDLHGQVDNPQSLNRYAYALGNPIMGVDPSGYCYNLAFAGSLADSSTNNYELCKPISKDFSDSIINPIINTIFHTINATIDVTVAIGAKIWSEAVYKPAESIVNGYKNAEGLGFVSATLNVPYQMMIGVGNALPLGATINAGKASVELGVNRSGFSEDKKEKYIGLYNNTVDTIAVVNTFKSGPKKGGDFSKDKSYASLKASNAEIRRYFASGYGLRVDKLRLWRDSLHQNYRKLMYINIENLSDGAGIINYAEELIR